ncbi:MAG: hypothetical protein GX568_00650 [Candidatus Gastranaerophilales bacterium]|jgi:hypothetical protein|nr:hypothetical protein [Candidatus Gastranaerophilales bacterium]
MITKIAPMQTPIKAYNNNKAPAFGKLDIDNSVFLPYISKHFTETDKSFNERIILDDFNSAKNKFMPDIQKLENKEIDMSIKGIDYCNAFGGTGFISSIIDKKTGMTHLFAQRYDAYDDSLLAPSMRPTPFTVIYKTVERAFEVLNQRE